jgi:hypothetical protein
MSLYVVSRRKIVFQQGGAGGAQVIYVPSADQIQVLKDAAGTTVIKNNPTQQTKGLSRGPMLARVAKGQRTLFGQLPLQITDLGETVKVWLAEDLVPLEAEAFFYVFSATVVIHGVREMNDEGKDAWRTAQLQLPEEGSLEALQVIMSDFRLSNPNRPVCLAVANDMKLYRELQQNTSGHGYTAVPFATLRPQPKVSPLYSHRNYTWLFMALILLGALGVVGVAGYYFMNMQETKRVEQAITDTQNQINSVTINPQTGHIRQPEPVLQAMQNVLSTSPSALIQAAAAIGKNLGDLDKVEMSVAVANAGTESSDIGLLNSPDLQMVKLHIRDPQDLLLVDQAAHALNLLEQSPGVRQIMRIGSADAQSLDLVVMLQAAAPVESLLTNTTEPLVLPEKIDISASVVVSGTVAVSQSMPPLVSETTK